MGGIHVVMEHKMKKIIKIAKRTKDGSIKTTKMGNEHIDIPGPGEHGFIASDNKFKSRTQAAKIAKEAGQNKHAVRKLHSTDLKAHKPK